MQYSPHNHTYIYNIRAAHALINRLVLSGVVICVTALAAALSPFSQHNSRFHQMIIGFITLSAFITLSSISRVIKVGYVPFHETVIGFKKLSSVS